ncbi:hypothetical protein Tco_1419216 [Tanacetum coccineum]
MVAWFLELEDVLSWLLVEGKLDDTTVDRNVIALLRQAIRSLPGRNDGTASSESSWGNLACGCCEIGGLLHKLICMVEKNELVEELMIVIVDTEQNVTEFDGQQPMQEDPDIFHAVVVLHLHVPHVD